MNVDAADTPEADSTDALTGVMLLDRYRIEEIIGRGGMSVVYRAQDQRLDRPVAVKVFSRLTAALSSTVARAVYEQFVQEAFALSQLNHPNTVRIYDFLAATSDPPHAPFQVVEYLSGGTLLDRVTQRGPVPPLKAKRVLEHIGGALEEAHSRGIVHRDVKPSNILFGLAGSVSVVKLSDFSIASSGRRQDPVLQRALSEDTEISTVSFYSLGWSAPEQIRGEEVSLVADIYGLGITLAFMLAGKRLREKHTKRDFFAASSVLDAALEKAVRDAHLPAGLTELCLTACRAEPKERYQNVEEFLRALARATAPRPLPADAGLSSSDVEGSALPQARTISDSLPFGPVDTATEVASNDPEIVRLSALDQSNIVAKGRRIRVVDATSPVDLTTRAGARLRFLFLPTAPERSRVHVRGLNCFVKKTPGSPTSGIDITEDMEFEMVGVDRKPRGLGRIKLARIANTVRTFQARGLRLEIAASAANDLACLEFDDEVELFLLHRSWKEIEP